MRCSKSQIFLQHATVRFHKWNCTVACCKTFCHLFIYSRSLISSLSLSLSISSLSSLLKKVAQDHSPVLAVDLAASLSSPRRQSHQSSLLTSTALTSNLQISLNRVMGVRFGLGFACSLPSAGDHSNIILEVPRSNHKKQGKFKDNIIK